VTEFRCTYRLQLNEGFGFRAARETALPYVHELGASHLYLSHRHTVRGDRLRTDGHVPQAHPAQAHAAHAAAVVRPREHLLLPIAQLPTRPGQEPCLLSVLERIEFRDRTAQADLLPRRRINETDRHKTTRPLPVLAFDDEMRERASNGINHDTSQLPTDAVATRHLASDDELRGLVHKLASRLGFLRSSSALTASQNAAPLAHVPARVCVAYQRRAANEITLRRERRNGHFAGGADEL